MGLVLVVLEVVVAAGAGGSMEPRVGPEALCTSRQRLGPIDDGAWTGRIPDVWEWGGSIYNSI